MSSGLNGAGSSRALHGARGLKHAGTGQTSIEASRRALHGARGLKPNGIGLSANAGLSRPSRGAWIETSFSMPMSISTGVAPFTGRVD